MGCRSIDKYSYLATIDEIKENEFNLNIPRYVDTFEEEEEVDIPATQKEIEGLEKELVKVRGEMDGYLKELGLQVKLLTPIISLRPLINILI